MLNGASLTPKGIFAVVTLVLLMDSKIESTHAGCILHVSCSRHTARIFVNSCQEGTDMQPVPQFTIFPYALFVL
jgi:hypothetical protein